MAEDTAPDLFGPSTATEDQQYEEGECPKMINKKWKNHGIYWCNFYSQSYQN